ncbi:tetratricopeptide repeat protein [Mucilaginibacter terrae]|uniref:Tetratricopeptide (TPR) repeat protein n=1 Tax=Mucilaginibacter terrae TaxID=1955052 RepID=A0ABU3GQK2_9SPHI|nr:tetratricopeptide repeat protein [Mucilaginibacter terrae]MDT3401816.1 tetratricopeptide (TPR) repeat protein [Mucilaginibacter terrae]
MRKLLTCLILITLICSATAKANLLVEKRDTSEVLNDIARGFDVRLTDPTQTVKYADRALRLAKKINFTRGVAAAYRIKGLGEHYLGNSEKAIENYFEALANYQKVKDTVGEVRIYLNISTLYQYVDYDKCLEYLHEARNLYQSSKLDNLNILASIYLNLGNVYQLQANYNKALNNYMQGYKISEKLGIDELKVTAMQNLGVVYTSIGNTAKAKEYLFAALTLAKGLDLNSPVAQINLSLGEIYIAEGDYSKARQCLQEGKAYAVSSKSQKLLKNFETNSYLLEFKQKNYESALTHLQAIYKQDSIEYSSRNSAALTLFQAKYRQEQLRRENERITDRQKYERSVAIGTIVLAALLIVVIVLLTSNVKRKAETNKKLTELNAEISIQKDNLDRINHHLEEIIDERTKDLQLKNRKLSDYSSHLSHQVRGPIATLKGLMNLEQEGLVSQEECIQMMIKCVSEIDDKIIDMSDMLHNPERAGM